MLGGGLEKIFLLIGDERERKFLSKNLDQIPGHKSPDSLEKKKVWQNLVKFLKNELALREKFTLLQKVDYLGINSARRKSTSTGNNSIMINSANTCVDTR